ncbi:MAG: lycopene cyclase family protein [Ilumatobacteraceae bacterium]
MVLVGPDDADVDVRGVGRRGRPPRCVRGRVPDRRRVAHSPAARSPLRRVPQSTAAASARPRPGSPAPSPRCSTTCGARDRHRRRHPAHRPSGGRRNRRRGGVGPAARSRDGSPDGVRLGVARTSRRRRRRRGADGLAGVRGAGKRSAAEPTFVYLVQLEAGRWLVEETSLARRSPMPIDELRARLATRLGADLTGRAEHVEHVSIPMRPGVPSRLQPTVGFGAAADSSTRPRATR